MDWGRHRWSGVWRDVRGAYMEAGERLVPSGRPCSAREARKVIVVDRSPSPQSAGPAVVGASPVEPAAMKKLLSDIAVRVERSQVSST